MIPEEGNCIDSRSLQMKHETLKQDCLDQKCSETVETSKRLHAIIQ